MEIISQTTYRANKLLFQIRFSKVKYIGDRLRSLSQDVHNLLSRVDEHLEEVQNGKRGVCGRSSLVVAHHQHHSQREQLVEHRLPGAVFQQVRKHYHLLQRDLLRLLKRGSTARAKGVLHRDVEMDEQQSRYVDRRGNERVVGRLLHHLLCVTCREKSYCI